MYTRDFYIEKITALKSILDGDLALNSLSAWCEQNDIGHQVSTLLKCIIINPGGNENPNYEWMDEEFTPEQVADILLKHDEKHPQLYYFGADEKTIKSLKELKISEREYKIFLYLRELYKKVIDGDEFSLDDFFDNNNIHDHVRKLILEHYICKEDGKWVWSTTKPVMDFAKHLYTEIKTIKPYSNPSVKILHSKDTDESMLNALIDLKEMCDTNNLKSIEDFLKSHNMLFNTFKWLIDNSYIVRRSYKKKIIFSWISDEPDIKIARKMVKHTNPVQTISQESIAYNDSPTYIESDYTKFRFLLENRKINPKKVSDLVHSFRELGYIAGSEITIWKDGDILWIVGGQHRFEACKKSGTPVKYKIEKSIKNKDEAIKASRLLNKAQHTTAGKDWISSYASEGLPQYVLLKEMEYKYKKISRNIILTVATNYRADEDGKRLKDSMRIDYVIDGDLMFREDYIKRLDFTEYLAKHMDFKIYRPLAEAIFHIFEMDISDENIQKIKDNITDMQLRAYTDEYRMLFQNIINKNKRQENRIILI